MSFVIEKVKKEKYIYEQIYEYVKRQIIERKLTPHEQLPSKRSLAHQLNVSVNSVMTAYEELLAEGYIYAIERSGYFVQELDK